jgi:hypothetical protein
MKNLLAKYRKYLIVVTTIIPSLEIGALLLITSNNSQVSTTTSLPTWKSQSTTTIPPKTLPSVPLVPANWLKYDDERVLPNANAQLTLHELIVTGLNSKPPYETYIISIKYVITRWRNIPKSYIYSIKIEPRFHAPKNPNTLIVIVYATGDFWTAAGSGMGVVLDSPTGCGEDRVPTSEGNILSCSPIRHRYLADECVGVPNCLDLTD